MILEEILRHDDTFKYRLLSRLQHDCEFYLGFGNRCAKHLWAINEVEHIRYMKEIWDSFEDSEKPEWLSYEQILDYERQMIK